MSFANVGPGPAAGTARPLPVGGGRSAGRSRGHRAGYQAREIADQHGDGQPDLAAFTVAVHVSRILGKLGVRNRTEAATVGARLGLGRDSPEST
jgi:hypothetical protein